MLRKVRHPCTTVTAVIQFSSCGEPPQGELGLLDLYLLVFYKYGKEKKKSEFRILNEF